MNPVINKLDHLILVLSQNNQADWAARLQGYRPALKKNENDVAVLQEIKALCHPKAMGDVYIKTLEWPEWLHLVQDLGRACAKALR